MSSTMSKKEMEPAAEMHPLLPAPSSAKVSPEPSRRRKALPWALLLFWFVFCGLDIYNRVRPRYPAFDPELARNVCPQTDVAIPKRNHAVWANLGNQYGTGEFKERAVGWLGGAVRIPTESYDNMDPVGVDPRWDVFALLHEYLLAAYPLIHTTLALTKVNTYGLVYVWQGSDASLKPILLAAHQDVVPVHPDTVNEWDHPPYSGYFDGKRIWGRGSIDDKSGLIGALSSIETLLEAKFKPTRSIVLSFGFDEEASGTYGAQRLAAYLEETFGKDAFAMLVDEGAGFAEQFGRVFAVPGIAEKGYTDVRIQVTAPGGHSSIPPPHTSIGILSALLVKLEQNPIKPKLARGTPIFSTIQCLAVHGPDMPSHVKRAVQRSSSNAALRDTERYFFQRPSFRALVGTTQAIDLIQGGVKTNALPEQAWAVVNHRIATDSSLDAVKSRDTALLQPLARSFNLTYTAFGELLSDDDGYGTLTLSNAFNDGLEPAPITPTDEDAAPYKLLSGTIKATYNAHRNITAEETIVIAPGIMSGNTDTRYYWNLSKHIFRYNHLDGGHDGALPPGVHTVNEFVEADSFVEMIRFFTTLILNVDEATEL